MSKINLIHTVWVVAVGFFIASPVRAEGGESLAVEIGHQKTITSTVLERDMNLVVHLPENYDESDARYPVIYMMGSEYRSRFALWASALNCMTDTGQILPTILVGIDLPEGNGVLLPSRDQKDTSGPDRHLRFLVEEAIPYVDGTYRTAPYRVLFGASNSGLFCIYTLLTSPEIFNAYLASSPMLGWCWDLIVEKADRTLANEQYPSRFLYFVYSDDDYGRVTDFVPKFVDLLQQKSAKWLSFKSDLRINEGHVPAIDVPLALKALFPDYNPLDELSSLDKMKSHYHILSQRYGFHISIPFSLLFDFGIGKFMAKELEQAERVFAFALSEFPKNARSYIGMGIVKRDQGKTDEARQLFSKALGIDPENTLAKRLLDRLKQAESNQ